LYQNIFSDVRSTSCNSFGCKNKGACLTTLLQTIYEDSLIFSILSLFAWFLLHKFWTHFLLNTTLDFFKKAKGSEPSPEEAQRFVLKPNKDNCSLNAYHAVNLLYYFYLVIVCGLHLIASHGTITISITIPLIFSGIGYHVFIWIWHRNLSKKARTKFDSFSKMNSAHHFTGIALYVFMLYYTCQELSAHKVDLPFSESTAAGSAEYRRLLYLHLAERHSNIGSTLMRQFCINAIPMLAIKIFEFQMIQITPGAQSIPKIFGIKLRPKFLLCLQTVFCFLVGPVAIGQSNQGYVIAVVLLFFLRQIYVIYSSAKLLKIVQINEN